MEYKKYADSLTEGFMEAEKLLQEERIFVDDDVPYSTQLIPLSAICAVLIQNRVPPYIKRQRKLSFFDFLCQALPDRTHQQSRKCVFPGQ